MIPTKQTILHDPANGKHGNCLSAVLASLLHMDINDVPVFSTPGTWVQDLNAWLRPKGLAYCMIEDFDCHIDAYGIDGLHHEISGQTSRSKDVTHACVAKDGKLAFDPHPDGTGLTKIDCHGFFIALEPWRMVSSIAPNSVEEQSAQIAYQTYCLHAASIDEEGLSCHAFHWSQLDPGTQACWAAVAKRLRAGEVV